MDLKTNKKIKMIISITRAKSNIDKEYMISKIFKILKKSKINNIVRNGKL
jgi:hypothetical protein